MQRARLLFAMLAALLLAAAPAAAQEKQPIRIGAIYILSGAFATYGEFARNGIQLAVDEINESGGILGRPVAFMMEDSQGKANVAIQAARKLVFQENVDLLMGLDSSGVANGIAPVVPELQRPFLITHAASPDVTGKLCNKWLFRNSVNVNQNMKAAALVAKELDARRWTTIGPDYAFGHQSWEFFQKYLKAEKPDVEFMAETAFPKFGAEDFTPFINAVIAAKPDGVLISEWGGDLVNFVRQANNLGFFDQDFELLMTLGAATEVLYALGDQMPEGKWVGTRYWFLGKDTPRNKAFVEAYHKRFGNYPSYNAQNAYAGVYTFKAAIEKADTVEPERVIEAMSGLEVEAPIGTYTIRREDHQALVDGFWGVTKASGDYPIRILEPMRVFAAADITPPPEETGCNLQQTAEQ
ncbi:MAG: ABC transporter substrate-binding protein [Rhodospirillales bacterium]|nr:ABC transporter substrate-binding protein [Rhodospirillales bacterium]